MIDLLSVYVCPECGDILEDKVSSIEMIDTDQDEVWWEHFCDHCGRDVKRKTETIDGKEVECFEKVDHERWLWASGYYDEPTEP